MREARRRSQKKTKKARKRRWPRVIAILLGLIVVLGVLVVVFFTPLNNTYRNVTGNDTPADSAVKSQLVKQIETHKTGDPTTDAALDKAASTLDNTKMSTIVQAAGNQDKFASLVQATTGVPAAQANTAAAAVFSSSELAPLREAVAQGNYVKAYQEYQALSATAKAQASSLLSTVK
ncbi:hypothetical protein [Lacticaseibacillus camelliae]|uniref:hypothetical protein n=1 Tax=Lacticaseibacillus camelliae TaxID=381742 RepID=UPI0006D0F8F3|nr:hypothetical protein [Lacticaseibacillus camelliae]